MDRDVRLRFWFEVGLAAVSLFLLVLTIAWPEWIEEIFGIEPDGGNGMAEWGIVVVFAVATAALALTARREWRNATVTAAGADQSSGAGDPRSVSMRRFRSNSSSVIDTW